MEGDRAIVKVDVPVNLYPASNGTYSPYPITADPGLVSPNLAEFYLHELYISLRRTYAESWTSKSIIRLPTR